ncbi:MAG TPA: hypothetical protein VF669_11540 [Tepidisphaeraceae bacterium]|jgi:hypothetical protein
MRSRLTALLFVITGALSMLLLSGCAALGVAAHAMPPPTVLPAYNGLAGQSVGVMVWADRGVRIDFPAMQVDLANAVQKRLQAATPKAKQLKGATFPVQPASIVRYQQDHPEIEGSPVAQVAPRLGVSRLVYIEIENFATRSDLSVDLFRGTASASIKVLEITGQQANTGYNESGIKVAFPPKAPREGIPNVGDYRIYAGTIDSLATQIANRLLPHEEEER